MAQVAKTNDKLTEDLIRCAEKGLNVLMSGPHGVGKTDRLMAVAKATGLKLKYYSTPTLDPWADIVGIPAPDKEKGSLKFYRAKELMDAEIIFFDELNRAHPRVLNAVMELIQFKSINGEPLPNLKLVWAAINPADGIYNVEELDPALVDRFHVYMNVYAQPNVAILARSMPKDVAETIINWWKNELTQDQRKKISPRRLEYLGMMHVQGIDLAQGCPDKDVPVKLLKERLKGNKGISMVALYNPISAELKQQVKNDMNTAIEVMKVLSDKTPEQWARCGEVFDVLPEELLRGFIQHRRDDTLQKLVDHLRHSNDGAARRVIRVAAANGKSLH